MKIRRSRSYRNELMRIEALTSASARMRLMDYIVERSLLHVVD